MSGQQIWRQVNVLSQAFSFNNASVDNGTPVTGQTTMTLTPDGGTTNTLAYIRFAPSDPTVNWHVVISSDGFQDIVYERWGSSNPLSSVVWDGRDTRMGSVVPNGTYSVKLEIPGLTANTSLSIVVNTAKISGTVTLGGSPVAGAWVNANPGTSNVQTDSSGNYTLYGLRSGSVYNLFVSFVSTATQAQISGQINNVTSPASGQNFALANPGIIRIAAAAASTTTTTLFGSIPPYPAHHSHSYCEHV